MRDSSPTISPTTNVVDEAASDIDDAVDGRRSRLSTRHAQLARADEHDARPAADASEGASSGRRRVSSLSTRRALLVPVDDRDARPAAEATVRGSSPTHAQHRLADDDAASDTNDAVDGRRLSARPVRSGPPLPSRRRRVLVAAMNWVLAGVLAYVVAQLLIGLVVSRNVASHEDYLLAGRRFGPFLATFSVFATWFGAETCIGAAGVVYESGFAEIPKDPFGYGACLLVMGAFFAVPLWRRKLTTLADLFRQRWSPRVERLAALLMIPTSILWAAAQVRAFGTVVAATSDGVPVEVAVTVAALVVVVYTATGGLLADAVTDLVQGAALVAGLVVIAVVVMMDAGGTSAAVAVIPAGHLDVGAEAASIWSVIDAWAVPICGSVVAQELVMRVLASRSAAVARGAPLVGGAAYLLIGAIPLFLGLYAAGAMPGLEEPEQALTLLAKERLGPVLYVVFAGALLSAILSTVDSTLLAASSVASQNLVVSLRPAMTDATKLKVDRGFVVGGGLIAWALALSADGVYELVEQASAFGSSGMFVIVCAGLWTTRFGGPAAAASALVVGAGVWAGLTIAVVEAPYLWSLVAAIAAYVGAAAAKR